LLGDIASFYIVAVTPNQENVMITLVVMENYLRNQYVVKDDHSVFFLPILLNDIVELPKFEEGIAKLTEVSKKMKGLESRNSVCEL
jgi:hypothetical protein